MGEIFMIGRGYVGPMGKYLSVSFDERDWHVMIRRIDKQSCDSFGQYSGKIVTNVEVEQFLPNWNSLVWKSSSVAYSRGLTAHDDRFSVTLLTTKDCSLSDEQIIIEFKKFMANGQDRDIYQDSRAFPSPRLI